MGRGIKLLITGLENSGKTTLTSKIEDAMVVVIDDKKYPYKVPHYKPSEYNGIVEFKNELVEKIKTYKEKYGEVPRTVVIDTVTKLYELMYRYAQANFKGYDVHNSISNDTLSFNSLIENLLISRGINVVVAAHVQFDQNTSRYIVPATGQFKDTGSWLSIVDEASFIHNIGTTRYIAHSDLKYPCRTTLSGMLTQTIDEYDINKHIKDLEAKADDAEEMVL